MEPRREEAQQAYERAQSVACRTPIRPGSLRRPRILYVVAGVGSLTRLDIAMASAQRVEAMQSSGLIEFACRIFVYANVSVLPREALEANKPSACEMLRGRGSMVTFLAAVASKDVRWADAVLVVPSSVELGSDVCLRMLFRIMHANCVELASPACSTCKTKRDINHVWSASVGRRRPEVDLIAPLMTVDAFRCLQELLSLTAPFDTYAWGSWNLFFRYCRRTHLARGVAIVDAMSVHKLESGNTYSWLDANANAVDVEVRVYKAHPELRNATSALSSLVQHALALTPPPPLSDPTDGDDDGRGDSSHAGMRTDSAGTPQGGRRGRDLRLLDVVMLEPREPDRRLGWGVECGADCVMLDVERDVGSLMRAIRYRLRAHAAIASEVVVFDTNVSLNGRGQLVRWPLLAHSTEWLDAREMAAHNVTYVVVRGAARMRGIDMTRGGMNSTIYPLGTLWSEAMAWLELHRQGAQLAYAAGPTEVLDAPRMIELLRDHHTALTNDGRGLRGVVLDSAPRSSARPTGGLPASNRSHRSGAPNVGSGMHDERSVTAEDVRQKSEAAPLLGVSPLGPWLAGGCAIPRLRGLRFGDARCPLSPFRIGIARDPLPGWARSAVLFSLGSDWPSFRGRRSAVLMREPPPLAWTSPWSNRLLSRHRQLVTPFFPMPPRSGWPDACTIVPVLEMPACQNLLCEPERTSDFNDLCPRVTSCHAHEVRRRRGRERRHLGWHFVDATRPLRAMVRELNATVPSAAIDLSRLPNGSVINTMFSGGEREQYLALPIAEKRALGALKRAMSAAAAMDGAHLGGTGTSGGARSHQAHAFESYVRVVRARHAALVAAAGGQVPSALAVQRRTEAMIAILVNSCTDYHLLGLELTPGAANRSCSDGSLLDRAHAYALRHMAPRELLTTDYAASIGDAAGGMLGGSEQSLLPIDEDSDAHLLPPVPGWPRHTAIL